MGDEEGRQVRGGWRVPGTQLLRPWWRSVLALGTKARAVGKGLCHADTRGSVTRAAIAPFSLDVRARLRPQAGVIKRAFLLLFLLLSLLPSHARACCETVLTVVTGVTAAT